MFLKRYLTTDPPEGGGVDPKDNLSTAAGDDRKKPGDDEAGKPGNTVVEPDFDAFLDKKTSGKIKKWEDVESRLTDYELKTKELEDFKEKQAKRPEGLVKFEKMIESGIDISQFVKASSLDPESTDDIYLLKEGLKIAGKSPEAVDAKIKGFQKFLSNEKLESMQKRFDEGKIEKHELDDFMEEREIKKAELAAEVKDAKVAMAKYKQEYSLEYIDKAREEHVTKTTLQKEAAKKDWDQSVDGVVKDLIAINTDILISEGVKFDYKLTDPQKEDLLIKMRAANSLGIPKEAIKDYAKQLVWTQHGPAILKAAVERTKSAENLRFAKILEGKVDKPGGASKNVATKTEKGNETLADMVRQNNRL